MISEERRKALIAHAEQLADELGRFRAQGSSDPVDPSRLAEVQRYVAANGTAELAQMLDALPNSYLQKASRSARPQLEEVRRRVKPLAKSIPDREELSYVLAWARRLMSIAETTGLPAAGDRGPRRDARGRR